MNTSEPSTERPPAGPPAPAFRGMPSVHELIECAELAECRTRIPRGEIVSAARTVLSEYRRQVAGDSATIGGGHLPPVPNRDEFARQVIERLRRTERPRLRRVINASGVILHTGLGRAPLAQAAIDSLAEIGRNYASVELDLDSGERGKRTHIVRELLCKLTGAESATIVNNNAAATLIVLAATATGRSVLVSRGELIEIGGSFRLPEIMEVSGSRLREVGTTNKTRISDYSNAIDDSVAALMKVHTSNFKVVGFTESVTIPDLVRLGRERGLPVIDDIGSGALVDFSQFGFSDEPVASASIAAGADLVLFSGDKLVGGPQAGIIVGRREWIDRIEKHPLMRAFRVDKLTLAALQATLRIYRDPARALEIIPILAMIREPISELRERASRFATACQTLTGVAEAILADDTTYLGGGSLPTQGISTVTVRIRATGQSETEFGRRLRLGDPAVVARVQDGVVIFDLRTVFPGQLGELVAAIQSALL